MGIVLDSSLLIAAEREHRPVSLLLTSIDSGHAETEFMLSSITAPRQYARSRRHTTPLLDEVLAVIPVEPFTRQMGVLAGEIDAGMKKAGIVVATADLLIGVTALIHGYAIGTRNVRHFRMIPGLKVIPL